MKPLLWTAGQKVLLEIISVSKQKIHYFCRTVISDKVARLQPFKRQPHKMVKHIQTIRWQFADELF